MSCGPARIGLLVLLAAVAAACANGGDVSDPLGAAEDEHEDEVIPPSGDGGSAGDTGADDDCSDGFANGDEEGVDCGGSCGPCCEPATYDKTSGLASGSVTICCDDGDTLAAATDCGVGDNHGTNIEGTCAVGFEGAMNNGTACVSITCETGCAADSTSSSSAGGGGSTSSTSSGAGGADTGGCAHDPCEAGDALEATCDPCVDEICAEDSYCCDAEGGAWDEACVGLVSTVCRNVC